MANNTIIWTDEMLSYLRDHFPVESACDIAEYFGISYTTVRKKALSLGLEKSKDYSMRKFHHRWVKDYKHGWYKNFKAA